MAQETPPAGQPTPDFVAEEKVQSVRILSITDRKLEGPEIAARQDSSSSTSPAASQAQAGGSGDGWNAIR